MRNRLAESVYLTRPTLLNDYWREKRNENKTKQLKQDQRKINVKCVGILKK